MGGMDKPTGRVVALIVLLVVVAAALRGYLPAQDHPARAEPGSGRAAMTFVVAALAGTSALLAISVVARLRDPRAVAPSVGDPSQMLGTGRGRPSWRVLLIALGVVAAWLVVAMLLAQLWVPHEGAPSTPAPSDAPQPGQTPPPRPPPHPQNDTGDMLGILLAATIPMLLVIVVGSVIMSRRRRRASAPGAAVAKGDSHSPVPRSESLARAAELGLAEVADSSRDPREAIIACYAAMERELANVPGAVPQEFDTPTEVLARAVEHHALHADNAVQLVKLFAEARFSPHVMNETHRDAAVHLLQLVLDELGSRSAA